MLCLWLLFSALHLQWSVSANLSSKTSSLYGATLLSIWGHVSVSVWGNNSTFSSIFGCQLTPEVIPGGASSILFTRVWITVPVFCHIVIKFCETEESFRSMSQLSVGLLHMIFTLQNDLRRCFLFFIFKI